MTCEEEENGRKNLQILSHMVLPDHVLPSVPRAHHLCFHSSQFTKLMVCNKGQSHAEQCVPIM